MTGHTGFRFNLIMSGLTFYLYNEVRPSGRHPRPPRLHQHSHRKDHGALATGVAALDPAPESRGGPPPEGSVGHTC